MKMELESALADLDVRVVHGDPDIPQTDLIIAARAEIFLGNCVSSFSAFIKREREFVFQKPSMFFGIDRTFPCLVYSALFSDWPNESPDEFQSLQLVICANATDIVFNSLLLVFCLQSLVFSLIVSYGSSACFSCRTNKLME